MPNRPAMLNARKEESKGGTIALLVFLCIVTALLCADTWFYSRFFVMKVQGGSMDDTFYGGTEVAPDVWEGCNIVYADSLAEAERGDVVIIDVRKYETAGLFSRGTGRIIKRLIAVGGDELYCEGHVLYLKKAGETAFSRLEESYVHYTTPDFGPVQVGEGEVFVLGDHRDISHDSRSVGCFAEGDILAVVPDWAIAAKDATTSWEGFREAIYGKLAEFRDWLFSAFTA